MTRTLSQNAACLHYLLFGDVELEVARRDQVHHSEVDLDLIQAHQSGRIEERGRGILGTGACPVDRGPQVEAPDLLEAEPTALRRSDPGVHHEYGGAHCDQPPSHVAACVM
jgi:hypothetical protein